MMLVPSESSRKIKATNTVAYGLFLIISSLNMLLKDNFTIDIALVTGVNVINWELNIILNTYSKL